mgnify:CR=1 FL=1
MNKIELANKIRALDCLSNEDKTALLQLIWEHKKYGLVWEEKPEEIEDKLREQLPVLKEVPDRAILEGGHDAPNHILIEGDNLEALTTLSYTHEGKIDVIYIDPPYNTGRDFIYNDSFVEITNDFKHSKWLSFMSKRLRIAKFLLKNTGVIFISIDDNEQAQLKLLCDEVFTGSNFVASFCVIRAEGGGMAKQVIKGHDYCLVYARDINVFIPLGKPKDIRGKIITRNGIDYWIQEDWLRKEFGKYGNCHYEEILEYKGQECLDEINRGLKAGSYMLIPKSNGLNIVGKLRRVDEDSSKFYSILKHLNKEGVNEMKELGIGFDYPKPLSLITELIRGATLFRKKSIVLDFFAGSGTTLHAVMQLNAEDGGHRQCILCTNNENGICENVTYERNKRVIQGYTKPNGEKVEGLKDNNLRYYRTDYVGRSRTMRNMHALVNMSTDMLCIKEDLYTEQKRMGGAKTHPQIFRFFDDGRRQMLIIYREEYIEEIVGIIEKMDVAQPMKVYVFSPSENPNSELFESVADKVELTALPAAIYNTYKRILPKRKPQFLDGISKEEDAEASEDVSTVDFGGLFGEGGEE